MVSHRFVPQNRWRRFVSGLASKPLGQFSPVWPENQWRRFLAVGPQNQLRRFLVVDEDINPDKGTTTPTKPAQAPPGPLTRACARELNFVMILKNEGPEAS
jgi:hypothetical protein